MSQWCELIQQHLAELVSDPRHLSAQEVAKAINDKYGTDITRSAVIGRCYRTGLRLPLQSCSPEARQHASDRQRKSPRRQAPWALPRISPPEPVPDLVMHPCSFMDLADHNCRWGIGEVGEPGFFFCGSPTADLMGGRPYCAHHAHLAKGKPSNKKLERMASLFSPARAAA